MENPDRIEWLPNSLCENLSLSLPKDSVPALSKLFFICEVIVVFEDIPKPCSLVCHVLFLIMSPVG